MSNDYLVDMNDGEIDLYRRLKSLENDSFKVIPNVMLEKNKKGSNQIDLMVVCNKGLFVYEMKDFKGWIFGNENNKEWKQVLVNGKSSKKFSFRNPVKQNDNHIKTIKKLLTELGYNIPIYNVVVFGENATLKNVEASSDVVMINEATSVINKYPELVISEDKLNDIADVLRAMNVTDEAQREEHIIYASSFQEEMINTDNVTTVDNINTEVQGSIHNNSETYYSKGGKFIYEEKVDRRDVNIKKEMFSTRLTNLNKLLSVLLLLILLYFMDIGFISFIIAIGIISIALKVKTKKYIPWLVVLCVFMVPVFLLNNILSSEIEIYDNLPVSSNNTVEGSTSTKSVDSKEEVSDDVVNTPIVKEEKTKSATNMWASKDESDSATEIDNNEVPSEVDVETETHVESENTGVQSDEELVEPNIDEVEQIIETEPIDNSNKLVLGSCIEQVNLLLGEPDAISGQRNNVYVYGNSTIYFDEENNVLGYNNEKNQLDTVLPEQTINDHSLFIGDSKAEVMAKIGAPTEIKSSNINVWYVETSTLSFDLEGILIAYDNSRGYLDDYLPLQDNRNETFFIGDTEAEVIRKVGSPTKILAAHGYSWYYTNDRINFDENGLVVGYISSTYNLKGLLPEKSNFSDTMFIGGSKEEALEIFGAPSEINSTYPNTWEYVLDKLYFDESGKLIGYTDGYNHLSAGLPQENSGDSTFFIGSSKEEVLSIMGAPSEISSAYPNTWEYSLDRIYFDENGMVIGYDNGYNHFSEGLPEIINEDNTFTIGDDKQVVLDVMGAPSEIKASYPNYWYYSNSKVIFENNIVIDWDDSRGVLKVSE